MPENQLEINGKIILILEQQAEQIRNLAKGLTDLNERVKELESKHFV